MSRLFALLGVMVLVGCDCGGGGPTAGVGAELAMPPAPDEVPQPGSVYREAYEQAKKEITQDNAYEKLDEIERQVTREREELR